MICNVLYLDVFNVCEAYLYVNVCEDYLDIFKVFEEYSDFLNADGTYLNFSKDNRCQGSVELILILGGIIVIILLVVALYKSYIVGLGGEINSGEVKALNDSFSEISSRFE